MVESGMLMTTFQHAAGTEVMKTPQDIAAILKLHQLGWGKKAIARELGISKNTVRRYLDAGGVLDYAKPQRSSLLEGQGAWLAQELRRHRGNADVVRQELERQKGIQVSLRTVQRAVQEHRVQMEAEAKATLRFETPPGLQGQADFGTMRVQIAGEWVRVHLFVMTLGFSRRVFVAAFLDETRCSWQVGLERAFLHFGGVTYEVLIDNAKALVKSHDIARHQVEFSGPFLAFARYWGFQPRACAPYRARTKGKDENGVGYVKKNAIAGRCFDSWAQLEAHLQWWMREIADQRIHGTTGERPCQRFEREREALKPLSGRPPFVQARELSRVVHNDLCVEVDTNHYSVPWRYIGEQVTVHIQDRILSVFYAGERIAHHPLSRGRRQRRVDPQHLKGLSALKPVVPVDGQLQRSLAEYAAVAGGLG
jgi:transposase